MQTINLTLQIPNQEDLNLLLKLVKRLGIKTLDIQTPQSKKQALGAEKSSDFSIIQKYVRPIRKKTDVEALIKAKGYQGVDKQKFKQITQSIDIPQSTDELLNML
ncbi:MAG: hypothetical protein AB8B69_03205 [Chitinophagales bacterium]